MTASASTRTMKHHWAASGREPPGRCVQLRLCQLSLSLREYLLDLLEQL
jgi:hypothetical protein